MASLTYWYCECKDDSDVYSIVEKTKKDAAAKRSAYGESRFEPPVKKTIQYRDAFDLFSWCTSEGGGRSCGTSE